MNIAIVDDDPACLEVLCETMEILGHKPYPCNDAVQGILAMPYTDAVICDGLYGAYREVMSPYIFRGKPAILHSGDREALFEARQRGWEAIERPAPLEFWREWCAALAAGSVR